MNKKVLVLVGIPGSGKTTWAKEFIKKNDGWVRVCRDEYRKMLTGEQIMDRKGENLVTDLVDKAISNALRLKYNVIIDQTNVKAKYLNKLIDKIQTQADISFRIFDISKDLAVERDSSRGARSVGEEVINKMFDSYTALFNSNFDFNDRKQKPRLPSSRIILNSTKPNAVVFDIDGTLAHNEGRRGYYDWKKVGVDVVDEIVRDILYHYASSGVKIIIITARDGICRDETKAWLKRNDIVYNDFFIKPENDNRKDRIVKAEIYENHIKPNYNVIAVFDDRDQVVEMWRGLGIKCFQVENGSF